VTVPVRFGLVSVPRDLFTEYEVDVVEPYFKLPATEAVNVIDLSLPSPAGGAIPAER
jgi:hypothetical protein